MFNIKFLSVRNDILHKLVYEFIDYGHGDKNRTNPHHTIVALIVSKSNRVTIVDSVVETNHPLPAVLDAELFGDVCA